MLGWFKLNQRNRLWYAILIMLVWVNLIIIHIDFNHQVTTQLTTSRIILDLIYQDRLKPPDEFDQIMFTVKNTYDQYLFNLSAKSTEFETYENLQTEAYEYSFEKAQWSMRVTISFFQPIKLTLTLFDAVVEHLMQQKQFEIATIMNSLGMPCLRSLAIKQIA